MATFGNTATGTSPTDNPANNWVWLKASSTPASNGSLTSISAYGKIRAGVTVKLQVALYTDSAGAPATLLGSETTTLGSFTGIMSVVTTTLSTPISITSGTQYWFALAILNGAGGVTDADIYTTAASGTELYYKDFGSGSGAPFPSPASEHGFTGNDNTLRYAVFGTYTPAGGSETITVDKWFQQNPDERRRSRTSASGIIGVKF